MDKLESIDLAALDHVTGGESWADWGGRVGGRVGGAAGSAWGPVGTAVGTAGGTAAGRWAGGQVDRWTGH
jgi:hypothetical protein